MPAAEFKNRIGHDNFHWWIGVVESSRQDPLNLGRCKVRVFGSHTDNLNLITTEGLPWAMPIKPTNASLDFTALREGQYCFGFYLDGDAGQQPAILGTFPGILQTEPDKNVDKGFQKFSNKSFFNDPAKSNTQILPLPPSNAPAMAIDRVGQPDTPTNVFSVANTVVGYTNSDLVHSCDFRFLVNFGDLNIGTIENPIKLIQDSIKDAKNKAAAIIKTLLSKLLDTFRVTFKGILVALNLDPTGQIGQAISQARDAIRKINAISRKIAEYVGSAALMVALVKELKQIVNWIKSLPKKVLGMLKECLNTFTNAIKTAAAQVKAIPGQVSNGLIGAFTDLQKSAEATQQAAETAQSSANVPNTLIQIVNSPASANNQELTVYINTEYPNTNTIIAQTNSSSHNPNNASLP